MKGASKMKTRTIQFADNLELQLNRNNKVVSQKYKGYLVRDFRQGEKALFVSPRDESFRYPFKVTSINES